MQDEHIRIRNATHQDADSIAAIYNDAVLNTAAIWNERTVDGQDRIQWMEDHRQAGYTVLVAVDDKDTVLGYATLSDWRAFDGYRHTAENSVYVRADQRGKGIGKMLMLALIEQAQSLEKHVIVAAIEGHNTASIKLHEQLGFESVGYMKEVGTKFGRWLDLAFLQLVLNK